MDQIISLITPKIETYYIFNNYTIRQALEKFDFHKFSVVPVIDEHGLYIGTISEGDILRFIKNKANFKLKELEKNKIIDLEVYRPYKALKIDSNFNQLYNLALEQNFVPLIDDNGIYIGIIKRKDILNELKNKAFTM